MWLALAMVGVVNSVLTFANSVDAPRDVHARDLQRRPCSRHALVSVRSGTSLLPASDPEHRPANRNANRDEYFHPIVDSRVVADGVLF